MNNVNKLTIYYDGTCPMCSALAERTSSEAKGVTRVDANSKLPPGVSREEAMREVYIIDENGTMHKGAAGIFRIFEEYPLLYPLAKLGRLPGFRHVAEIAYRFIARHRYFFFGKKEGA